MITDTMEAMKRQTLIFFFGGGRTQEKIANWEKWLFK